MNRTARTSSPFSIGCAAARGPATPRSSTPATRTGGVWNREQVAIAGHAGAIFDAASGVAVPKRMTRHRHLGWIDLSDCDPRFYLQKDGRWQRGVIEDFGGTFANKHARLFVDREGRVQPCWSHRTKPSFLRAILEGDKVVSLDRVELDSDPDGNHRPTAVDPVTGRACFLFRKAGAPTVKLFSLAEGKTSTLELTDVEGMLGRRARHAADPHASRRQAWTLATISLQVSPGLLPSV